MLETLPLYSFPASPDIQVIEAPVLLDSSEPILPVDSVASPPPVPAVQGENPIFNLADVLLIFVMALGTLGTCWFFAGIVIYVRHAGHLDEKSAVKYVPFFLAAQVVAYILTIGFMVLLIWQKYRTRFLEAIKWNMPQAKLAWGAIGIGVALAVATQIISGLLQPWIPKSLPIEQYFRTPGSAYALAAFGILVAPFVEEMFFRGFLFPALARPLGRVASKVFDTPLAQRLGLIGSIVITAFAFALIHGEQLANAWIPLLLLFTVGTVLTVARARTQSVAVSVLIHIGYNTTLFTMLYIATRGFRHMELG